MLNKKADPLDPRSQAEIIRSRQLDFTIKKGAPIGANQRRGLELSSNSGRRPFPLKGLGIVPNWRSVESGQVFGRVKGPRTRVKSLRGQPLDPGRRDVETWCGKGVVTGRKTGRRFRKKENLKNEISFLIRATYARKDPSPECPPGDTGMQLLTVY